MNIMVIQIILLALGIISLTIFLIEKVKAYSLKAVAFKALTSMFFIALAAYSTYKCLNRTFPMFALIALGFGMLGDIFLDLKYVFKEKDFGTYFFKRTKIFKESKRIFIFQRTFFVCTIKS